MYTHPVPKGFPLKPWLYEPKSAAASAGTTMGEMEISEGSGNFYRDIGLAAPETHLLKTGLATALMHYLIVKGWDASKAATSSVLLLLDSQQARPGSSPECNRIANCTQLLRFTMPYPRPDLSVRMPAFLAVGAMP